jgi:hypothetical protein
MKLKAFALTAGLLAFLGVTNAAWAYPTCAITDGTLVSKKGEACSTKDYQLNSESTCKCPGDNSAQTEKCQFAKKPYFSCQLESK